MLSLQKASRGGMCVKLAKQKNHQDREAIHTYSQQLIHVDTLENLGSVVYYRKYIFKGETIILKYIHSA